jgi:hypothetical protein
VPVERLPVSRFSPGTREISVQRRCGSLDAVSKKMAENAGVDLSDALRDLQSAIAEAYPKSDAAKTYPRAVAVARAHIDAGLAARRKRN